jgi:hypothetical protein
MPLFFEVPEKLYVPVRANFLISQGLNSAISQKTAVTPLPTGMATKITQIGYAYAELPDFAGSAVACARRQIATEFVNLNHAQILSVSGSFNKLGNSFKNIGNRDPGLAHNLIL